MRLFRFLPALGLLLGARASSLDMREPEPHRYDVRDLLDVCVYLNVDLKVPNVLGLLKVVGVLGASSFPSMSECN
jgi:hypothetical protein